MSFVDKEDGENVGSLVDNITIDGTTLTHTNLATFCGTDLEHLSELSQGLSEDMEHQEEELTTIESEDMHEVIVQTQEVEFDEKMDLTEIKNKNVVPPLRPLNIAPKPAKVPISFKPVTGPQLLVLQGGTTGQQIKLLSSNPGISLANLQLAKPITMKSTAGKVAGNTLSVVQPKQLVMKKVVGQVPKSTISKAYDTKGQQIMVVQKSEPQQIKLIQASTLTSTPTKTLTFAQAQQMGIISGSKIIPQSGSKQIILNKNQSKPIKIVPQIRSPTKILPAPQTTAQAGKVTQRIYLKPGGASQIIQVAGGQTINSGQFHQINIPGKGMQYIKFITASQPESASTTTVSTIQTTKAPSVGTKVIPISTASANIPMSDLKTITKSVTFNKQTKPTVQAPRLHSLNLNTIPSSANQVVVLPAGYTTTNQSTLKVAIPALRQSLPPSKPTVAAAATTLISTSGDAVVPNTAATHSPEISIESNGIRPRKPCNCTKSQCLKLYCDCFANGEFCYMCNCMNCFNNLENEEHRQRAIKNCLERNPNAFRPKIGKAKDTGDAAYRKHTKGCNCKRSGCLKNYCECYEAKIACSSNCKCMGCGNIEDCIEKKSSRSSMLSDSNYTISPNASKNSFSYSNYSRTRRVSTTKQAFNYVTSEVIEATCQCLLSLANNAEESEQDEELTKQQIVTEFGRCLKEIIDCSISKGNQSA